MKPVVRYKDAGPITPGESATVWPVDHPSPLCSNATWVRTSPVVRLWTDGPYRLCFETRNTIYMPVVDDDPPVQYAAKRNLSLKPVNLSAA